MKRLVTPALCAVALSSLCFSFPEAARANPDVGDLAPLESSQPRGQQQAKGAELISEVRTEQGTFRVVSVTRGDAGWFEITKTTLGSEKPTTLFQDTVIFTNNQNDGGPSVPLEVKRKLASDYAKHVIEGEGGVDAFSKSLKDYEVFGVPLPSGLYKAALIELGVRFP